jgi:hypothetical protein
MHSFLGQYFLLVSSHYKTGAISASEQSSCLRFPVFFYSNAKSNVSVEATREATLVIKCYKIEARVGFHNREKGWPDVQFKFTNIFFI